MFNTRLLLFKIVIVITILLFIYTGVTGRIQSNGGHADVFSAADELLNSLSEKQLKKITFDFPDEERFNWHYIPKSREGVPIKELNKEQNKLFENLLEASLSKQGVIKSEGVIILESVLHDLAGGGSYRDPGLYYITFFGSPDKIKPWGWRFEGHHLSLNFTVIKDSVVISTPMFFGANPSIVPEGKHKGFRLLRFEEDYARELVISLDKKQLDEAIIEKYAPSEIITGNDRKADPLNPMGIPGLKLNEDQREILIKLVKEYINNSSTEYAEQRRTDFDKNNINDIFFGWAGELEKGKPHYYRIQSRTFLIEYDNTQNNANHIHSVWRSFKNDFGVDLLKEHYRQYH